MQPQTFTKEELKAIQILVMNTDDTQIYANSGLSYTEVTALKKKLAKMVEPKDTGNEFNISYDYNGAQFLVVEDVKNNKTHNIPVGLLYDGKIAKYLIVDREQEIDILEQMIAECASQSDKKSMRKDLDTLKNSTEKFVLGKYGTNGFITKDGGIDEFNEACKELIQSYINAQSGVVASFNAESCIRDMPNLK